MLTNSTGVDDVGEVNGRNSDLSINNSLACEKNKTKKEKKENSSAVLSEVKFCVYIT